MAIDKIIHGVRKTVNELEQKYSQHLNWLSWEPHRMDGVRSATRSFNFSQMAIDLEIKIAFYLKADETDKHRALRKLEDDGAIGVMSLRWTRKTGQLVKWESCS